MPAELLRLAKLAHERNPAFKVEFYVTHARTEPERKRRALDLWAQECAEAELLRQRLAHDEMCLRHLWNPPPAPPSPGPEPAECPVPAIIIRVEQLVLHTRPSHAQATARAREAFKRKKPKKGRRFHQHYKLQVQGRGFYACHTTILTTTMIDLRKAVEDRAWMRVSNRNAWKIARLREERRK